MNTEDKLEGMLVKCSSGGIDGGGRVGLGGGGLVVMTLGERSLANHPLLAEDDEDDEDLTGSSLVTHDLIPPEQLMMQEEMIKNGRGEEEEGGGELSIKQELKSSESRVLMKKDKKAVKDLMICPKKKKRKQRSPAKILNITEEESLGMQSPKCHVCDHCNAAFRTNYHLQRHVFIHTGEKPFQCSQCDMRFIQKYLLQRHEKIHTGEKPFRCDECGMRFIQKYHMERHKRTHSGEKPYQCDYCHQYFSRTDRVLKHRRMCHENREREMAKAAGKGGPLREADPLALAFFARECSLPKKKRQKCANKTPGAPAAIAAIVDAETRDEQRQSRIQGVPYPAASSKVKHEYVIADYSSELPEESAGWRGEGATSAAAGTTPPKLVLKKVPKRSLKPSAEQTLPCLSTLSSFEETAKVSQYTFEIVDKQGLLEAEGGADTEAPGETLQGGPAKPAAASTNYDDAVQFLKKKRYLQAAMANSGRDYAVSSQPPAAHQSAAASAAIGEAAPAAAPLEPQPGKATHDKGALAEKGALPDEVLQTLLDHYSNKANGQSDISFSVADTEVTSSISINSSDVSEGGGGSGGAEGLGASGTTQAQPAPEKVSLLQEYSKFLQQALERTSQNDSYLTSQSLSLVSENPTLAGQPLFSTEKQFPSPSRFKSGLSSPLRPALEKPNFGLLVGDSQHSFSFSGDETSPTAAVSPAEEDFLEQVSPSKKTDASQGILQTFQISSFDQNFKSHFQASRPGAPSLFTVANGQLGLRGHGTDFSEFPAARVAETRSQLNSSPDVSSSETFG
ncbi:zinc finger protein 148 isoform X2 [Pungitius pungitius]|uniref:zinc finger protein 148 isoform X2 n=1 Tax=Pungitius pungitius TaxID=134920 RepID=UPI002E156A19